MWRAPFVQTVQAPIEVTTVPAPIGGLNAYDSLIAMPPTDALQLINWLPQSFGCLQRYGSMEHKLGLSSVFVGTLAVRDSNVYGWSSDKMYDVTSPGTVGAPLVSSLTSSYWQTVNMGNLAGNHLVAVNGLDNPIVVHPGNTVDRLTLGDGIVPYTISGVNPALFIDVTTHQHRLWFVEKNTTKGWYLPTNALYGVANKFDFGPLFKRGGTLAKLATWTVDDGGGSTDHLVAISTNGDVVVYLGIDVAEAGSWQLGGIYYLGAPLRGQRFATKVGGDLFLLTVAGAVSLGTVVTSTQVNVTTDVAVSRKIQHLLSDLIEQLWELDGWSLDFIPQLNQLYISIPSVTSGFSQLVLNMVTKAWTQFDGVDAFSWAVLDQKIYFGARNGKVYKFWTGSKDQVAIDGTGGTEIVTQAFQAYNNFGAPAIQKQVGMFKPNFVVNQPIAYKAEIFYDFNFGDVDIPNPLAPVGIALWGAGIWGVSTWSGGVRTQREWSQADGMGVAAALRMASQTSADVLWVSTDYTYKNGGVMG